jgi:hypothetical protein
MKPRRVLFQCLAALLACNYFAFRVELFGDEYERAHPARTGELSIGSVSLTWETFDKDNAPKAFVIEPVTPLVFLFTAPKPGEVEMPDCSPCTLVRDKSPPSSSLTITHP